jgi:hypothetical protein
VYSALTKLTFKKSYISIMTIKVPNQIISFRTNLKKGTFLFLLTFICIKIFSQETLTIKILTIRKEPIEYCSVAWDKQFGVVTNKEGVAILPFNKMSDSIIISSVGFQKKIVYKNSLAGKNYTEVILETSTEEMPPVVVWSNGKNEEFGITSKKEGPSYFMNKYGNNLQNIIQISGYTLPVRINKFSVFISHKSSAVTPFRIRAYDIGEDGRPGNDILHQNIIVTNYKKNRWHEVDLSDVSIHLKSSNFFIGIEWLSTDNVSLNGLCIGEDDQLRTSITYVKYGQSNWKSLSRKIEKKMLNSMMKVELNMAPKK